MHGLWVLDFPVCLGRTAWEVQSQHNVHSIQEATGPPISSSQQHHRLVCGWVCDAHMMKPTHNHAWIKPQCYALHRSEQCSLSRSTEYGKHCKATYPRLDWLPVDGHSSTPVVLLPATVPCRQYVMYTQVYCSPASTVPGWKSNRTLASKVIALQFLAETAI
jgi:hypothetical protein